MHTVRIGGASSHVVDSTLAVAQLLQAAPHYLIFDFMAEGSLGGLAQARKGDREAGYVTDFITFHLAPNLQDIVKQKVKLIANAGGLNTAACARAVEACLQEQGVALSVGYVSGDDLLPVADTLRATGVQDMFSGAPFPDTVDSVNAYLGAVPIAQALQGGADIVIVGRTADSSLALGPLIHEFGWRLDDWDRLAAGTLAGHLIECGCQVTGGTFTDWEAVPDWANIGFPIAEVSADGGCVITKPEGSGGLVSVATVAEQLLYEVSDPQAYIVPDVVCDFSDVKIEQQAENRVAVSGARGYPATDTYKVVASTQLGWRGTFSQVIIGMDAARKAERQGAALVQRGQRILAENKLADYCRSDVEAIGAEVSYGPASAARDTREVLMRVSVDHQDPAAVQRFLREAPVTSSAMAVGSTASISVGFAAVYKLFMCLVSKQQLCISVNVGGSEYASMRCAGEPFDHAAIVRPSPPGVPDTNAEQVEVPLIVLAWARSGDKGNLFNVGVIARHPDYLPYIRAALDPAHVSAFYAHLCPPGRRPAVRCYDVPGFNALNLVVLDALDGGIMCSPRVDSAAKGMAQQLLQLPVAVPRGLVER